MASKSERPTPLGVARARFVDGLPRKAGELKGSIALLAGSPGEERPREELRRRLHALYASAQVFQIAPLAQAVKDAIARLDRARDEKRPLRNEDLDALASLATTLPLLGQAEPAAPRASVELERASVERATWPWAPGFEGERREDTSRGSEPGTITAAVETLSLAKSPIATAFPSVSRPRSSSHGTGPRGFRGLDTVASVLVIDAEPWQVRVRAMLSPERFEVLGAADPEEALRLARSSGPDVVIADWNVLSRPGVDLVRRLREDPLTDFVPIVALIPNEVPFDPIAARELGADEVLTKPFEPADLENMVDRLTGRVVSRGALAGIAGEHTVEEIAERLAEELRRGLADAVDRGRELRIPLGDGTELLALLWSAIGRVRAHLAHRSGGRIHFRDGLVAGRPAFLTLVDEEGSAEALPATPISLRGRHVIVCDDDPAVVWFFAGLLREEGAVVEEASDGAEALELARRRSPDVLISDIVMPRLDGFALAREMKRDPALADVPVILISWKEDFLHRMRELQSGASGYLRKEAGASQILDAVREVLRPLARVEEQLRTGGDVRGRLERIGILRLIKAVAQYRPNARIVVRDARNLFELDLRGGHLVDLTRTASDGSFSRGMKVLVPLLGTTTGRFSVVESTTPVRPSIRGTIEEVLRTGTDQIAALVDAVTGKGLVLAAHVELDREVLASLLPASPEPMRAVVEALRSGKGPRALMLEGVVAPDELEAILLDLARQGAIVAVRGEQGEDRIAAAMRARSEMGRPTPLPSAPSQSASPSNVPAFEPVSTAGAPVERELGQRGSVREMAPPENASVGSGILDLDPPDHGFDRRGPRVSVPVDPGDLDTPFDEAKSGAVARTEAVEAAQPSDGGPPVPVASSQVATPGQAVGPSVPSGVSGAPADESGAVEGEVRADVRAVLPAAKAGSLSADQAVSHAEPLRPRAGRQVGPAAGSLEAPTASSIQPAASRKTGLGPLGWAFVVAVLLVIGFVVIRAFRFGLAVNRATTDFGMGTADGRTAFPVESEPEPVVEPTEDVLARPGESSPAAPAPRLNLTGYGRDEPRVVNELGVEVGEGEGLVVLEPAQGDGNLRVRLAGREFSVGRDPIAIALPAGVHEVSCVRGDRVSFRFIRVQAGHTRFVPPP